jgi:hypothetical protein
MQALKLRAKDSPYLARVVRAALPGAAFRRPIGVACRESYHVADYWDGGSRTYAYFVDLATMRTLSSEAMPKDARQVAGNAYGLPVGDVVISPGFAVVEHSIFCGKDTGYRVIFSAADIVSKLPEARSVVPERLLPPGTPPALLAPAT